MTRHLHWLSCSIAASVNDNDVNGRLPGSVSSCLVMRNTVRPQGFDSTWLEASICTTAKRPSPRINCPSARNRSF